ncbi:hypothetical protein ABZV58_03310 [Nocardia sp. NPDC004654]|uniref:hypothetical protein n=1 Tax=Nocardia sp. NPDC004654 TaxID=3154776 RepID=UPI0033B5570C
MKIIRSFGFAFAAAAGIVLAGSGLATADDTGSAESLTTLAELLATGSAGETKPTGNETGTGSAESLAPLLELLATGSAGETKPTGNETGTGSAESLAPLLELLATGSAGGGDATE